MGLKALLGPLADYLEAYPLPAFAISVTDHTAFKPAVVWANGQWGRISDDRDLEGAIGREGLASLAQWLGNSLGQRQLGKENAIHTIPIRFLKQTLRVVKTLVSSTFDQQLWVLTATDPVVVTTLDSTASVPTLRSASPMSRSRRTRRRSSLHTSSPLAIHANETAASAHDPHKSGSPQASPQSSPSLAAPPAPPTELDCRKLLDQTDWSKTSLGPRSTWSPVVEMMIDVILRSPTQDALWLGSDFNMIYNRNYAQIVHHPIMFGTSARVKDAWGPVWNDVLPTINRCLTLGQSCHFQDDLLLYRRGPTGHFVEKYHTWSFVPLFHHDGTPLGLFNPTIETTASVLARRRQETLRDLAEQVPLARTASEFYQTVASVIERNAKDVPFLAIYSSSADQSGADITASMQIHLEATVGVPDAHSSCPSTLSIPRRSARRPRPMNPPSSPTLSSHSTSSLTSKTERTRYSDVTEAWPLGDAVLHRQCVVMNDCSRLIKGFPIRQWDHLPESAIVIPIYADRSSTTPDAYILAGLNLQCPLDTAYEDWIHVLRSHISSALASVQGIEMADQRRMEEERMARAQTAWFQGAAHDLRSPLTLVAGPLDDVLRTSLSPSQRQSLTVAAQSVARIQRLVNTLLDFSRIEAGKLIGRFIALDLGSFVADIASLFAPAITRKGIELVVDIQPTESMVWVDPTLMETIVTNLMSNAVKYTHRGTIGVSVQLTSTHAVISVADTGCGIPKSELQDVTDRFTRATTAIQSGVEGTGIGLALTKELIDIHEGDFAITSRVEGEGGSGEGATSHGSTFTIRLPLRERFNESTTAETSSDRQQLGSYGRQRALEAMQSMDLTDYDAKSVDEGSERGGGDGFLFDPTDTLLLVDDNADIRRYIKRSVSPYCRVVEASNGIEALAMAHSMDSPPNLILSDLMMPGLTGTELLAQIRNGATTKHIPMMLLSAATDEEVRLEALTMGADDFILKPFKPKELLARIHLHMQLGKRRAYLERGFLQREHEIKVMSDYCPSGIVRADEHGTLTYANATWRSYCGMPDGQDLNEWTQFVDETTRDRLLALWETITVGDAEEMQATWTWSNGKTVTGMFVRLDRAGDGGSGSKGMLGCLQDITYQEERLHEAERRRIEAEESKRQQELLVDMTSHEIRTPVSAILQCSSLVKDNLLELRRELVERGTEGFVVTTEGLKELDRDIEALESIYQCGLVQERIAGDILSLARIQLDTLSFHSISTNLAQEAQKTASAFAAEAKMKGIQVDVEFGESIADLGVSHINTDHVRLRQIVTNLISNAIRFTASSPVRKITVRYDLARLPAEEGTCVVPDVDTPSACRRSSAEIAGHMEEGTPLWLFVSVTDTGPGLTAQESDIIFQRFTQGNKMIHSQYGGSGLGLFICRTFRFFIQTTYSAQPAAASAGPASGAVNVAIGSRARTASPLESTVSTISPAATESTRQALRVLIVEDNIINQTVLQRQLTKIGWSIANHGLEAIELLLAAYSSGRDRYDAILMDLEMPIMDGLTALTRIRELEGEGRLGRQMVIALTGNAREGQIQQARKAGMDDVVIKPYRLPDLVGRLRRAVDERLKEE